MKTLLAPAKLGTLLGLLAVIATPVAAQLRIVDYNTTDGPRVGLDVVLQAIGQEIVNGFAKPIDVLALQEQTSSAATTQSIVKLLNDVYGTGTYARATLDGATNGAGRPGLIFNTKTVQLIDQRAFGAVNVSAQARQTLRYQLRPVGYDATADFYVYSNHYKAGTTDSDLARRNSEATSLRANLDALEEGTHAILAGDYNIQRSSEPSYQTLLSPGAGQAFDPIGRPGNWNNSGAYRLVHTQAPAVSPPSGLVGGGMDDRFDFQLVTGEFLDGEGLDYLPGSYRAFGNNGTHGLNGNISSGTGASPAVLSALMTASDHLPVIADYQLPAVMSVVAAQIPATLPQGQVFQLPVTVSNLANVAVSLGADELDYMLSTSGSLSGVFSGTDLALGGGNTHYVTFDTATVGLKSGAITISSSSSGVANGHLTLPVMYEVSSQVLAGDYDGDGHVDAADYVVWRNALGTTYAQTDYVVWQQNFGKTTTSGVSAVAPEPATFLLMLSVVAPVVNHRRRV